MKIIAINQIVKGKNIPLNCAYLLYQNIAIESLPIQTKYKHNFIFLYA